jgi:hypothetical protein
MAGPNYSKVATGNINPSSFVKLDPSNYGCVLQCGSGDVPWGIAQAGTRTAPYPGFDDGLAAVAGENVAIYGPGNTGTAPLRVSAAVTPGLHLKPDTNGYGTPVTGTSDIFGAEAIEIAPANKIVPVLPMFGGTGFAT